MPIIENNVNNEKLVNELLDDEDYDQCKDLIDELNNGQTKSNYTLRNKSNENHEPSKFTRNPSSPMKRNNTSLMEESPKKRQRIPNLLPNSAHATLGDNNRPVRKFNLANKLNNSDCSSPTRKSTRQIAIMNNAGDQKKSFASTPKTDRQKQQSRIKELSEQNSAAIERNLSSNWGDILEELEEQTKELNDYVEKVSVKYGIDKEKLMKGLECDAETLRKRQKRINFGKVTPEYQRYIVEITRKKREPFHPKTPNKFRKCSRRKFDGLIKKWRKLLHVWDENPDLLPDYKTSIENSEQGCNEEDMTDDFGGASNIEISYNVDDYDIIDDDEDAQDVLKTAATSN